MKRCAIRTLLGLLLPVLVIVVVAAGAREMPRVVNLPPLLVALGISAAAWWLQALIYAVLASSRVGRVGMGDFFRVEMAGLFVALVSPIKGAELPYKAYLFRRLGLSAGEGSGVVVSRVLLDAAVLTPAALAALVLQTPSILEVQAPDLSPAVPFAAAVLTAVAAVAVVVRSGVKKSSPREVEIPRWRARISRFLREMRTSVVSVWRPQDRATPIYAIALTTAYWASRFSIGPLALMSVGWSGDWVPVVVAQLLLVALVLPFVPTPGGSGARELGLAALLSGHVPQGQLLGGLIVYAALSYWVPLVASAVFAGHELRREILRGWGSRAARRQGSPAGSVPSRERPGTPTPL